MTYPSKRQKLTFSATVRRSVIFLWTLKYVHAELNLNGVVENYVGSVEATEDFPAELTANFPVALLVLFF
jgi:hypothetical protein